MRLFDEMERSDSSPAAYGEDSFAFMNRADGVVWARIREVLDAWFADYPAEHAADLRERFRDRRPGAHQGAWWELYLHHLFSRLGYTITVHPELPDTTKRPDFELSRGEERLYVEATVVFSGIVDEGSDGVRQGWIMDAVNRGTSPNFFVGIDFDRIGEKRPRDRAIYRPLEEWLGGLDPDAVSAEYERTGEMPTKTLVIDDWQLQFEAIPIKPEARGEDESRQLLGMPPAIGGYVDDKEQLRDKLKHKGRAYETSEVPLVVAVNCASGFMGDEDISAVLYGGMVAQYPFGWEGARGDQRPINRFRQRDGIWRAKAGPRKQRMSAVLSAVQLHPHTAVKTYPRLWLNPSPHVPLSVDWPFTTWSCSDEDLVESEWHYADMARLLNLPAKWPGPEPPFERGA